MAKLAINFLKESIIDICSQIAMESRLLNLSLMSNKPSCSHIVASGYKSYRCYAVAIWLPIGYRYDLAWELRPEKSSVAIHRLFHFSNGLWLMATY